MDIRYCDKTPYDNHSMLYQNRPKESLLSLVKIGKSSKDEQ